MSQNIDWPGLLKWSLLYHDNTESSADVAAMSEEEKQWLQNAFDSAILDEMKRIKVLLHVLTLPEDARKLFIMSYHSKGAIAALEKKRTLRTLLEMRQEDEARKAQGLPTIANEEVTVNDDVHTTSDETIPEPTEDELRALRNKVRDEKLDALDELHDRVLKKDNSVGFVIYNGMAVLFKLLTTTTDLEIAQAAWQLLAVVVKHNPKAQDGALKEHLLQLALSYLYVEGHSACPSEQTKVSDNTTDTTHTEVAATASVATSFTPIPKQNFLPRPQIASSQGFSVIRAALYFLASQLESHKTSQLVFMANAGIGRVLDVFSLKGLSEDKFLPVRRRCLGVLLTLIDDSNDVMIHEQLKHALCAYHNAFITSRRSDDLVILDRVDDSSPIDGAVSTDAVQTTKTTTATAATPDEAASKGALVEVPEAPAKKGSTAAPVVVEGEHPAWQQDAVHVSNEASDTIPLNAVVAQLLGAVVDVDVLISMIGCDDSIGREDVLKLIIRVCELAPEQKARLNAGKVLANALVKRVGAITALCKRDPSEKSSYIEELNLITKANNGLLK